MSESIRVVVAGAGRVGTLHARALSQIPGVRIVAVCDPIQERAQSLAAACNAEARTLDDALADPATDAIVLATPSDLHAVQVRRCIDASKHTLCEFPLFDAPSRLRACFARAEQRGICVLVAHTTHYLPPYIEAKRILETGHLGKIHTAIYKRRLYRPGGLSSDRDWRDNALMHIGGHALDLLTWLLGYPSLNMRAFAVPSANQATQASLIFKAANGVLGHISIDFESQPNDIWLEIAGSEGTITASGFRRVEVNGRIEWEATSDDVAYHAAIASQDQDFVRALRREATHISPADTLRLNSYMSHAVRLSKVA